MLDIYINFELGIKQENNKITNETKSVLSSPTRPVLCVPFLLACFAGFWQAYSRSFSSMASLPSNPYAFPKTRTPFADAKKKNRCFLWW